MSPYLRAPTLLTLLAQGSPLIDALPTDPSLSSELTEAVAGLNRPAEHPQPQEGGFGGLAQGSDRSTGLGAPGLRPRAGAAADALALSTVPRGIVSQLALEVVGPQPPTELALALKRRIYLLSYCYDRTLSTDPTLRGEATYTLQITAQGLVQTVSSAGTLDPRVTSCTEDRLRRIALSPQPGPSRATITWRYTPP